VTAVCVFCSSSLLIDDRYLELAADVGQELGDRGWNLVSGGGSISMMGALTAAARAHGARTTGVIPDSLLAREVHDRESDELLITTDMRERKGIMDERSDAFLALPGGIGTLEELVEVWSSRSLNMHHKPVVVCDPWGDFALVRQQVDTWVDRGFVSPDARDELHWTSSVPEALDVIERSLAM
jgi:uncharacterized protein (TIGR00730 family)